MSPTIFGWPIGPAIIQICPFGPPKIRNFYHILCICEKTKFDFFQNIKKGSDRISYYKKSRLKITNQALDKLLKPFFTIQKYKIGPEILTEVMQYHKKALAVGFRAGLYQQLLNANKHTSYISKPWFDMYLSDRVPIVLNYNPFLAFKPEERPGYNDVVIRATNILVSSMRFMRTLREQVLEPEVYHLNPAKSDTERFRNIVKWIPTAFASYGAYAHKAFPLDMSQFGNLFNSTRIPEIGKDRLFCDPTAKHMLIMKNGHFYVFDMFDNDNNLLPPSHVHACVAHVAADNTPPPSNPVSILTSENRDVWAKARKELVAAGNEEVLNLIDTAAFNIVFDDTDTGMDPETIYRTFLYGNGANRWFDKSFSLIFTKDNQTALNFEHAWGDGVAVMRYFNEVSSDSVNKGHITPDSKPANIDASQHVRRLEFNLTPSLDSSIQSALQSYKVTTDALGVNIFQSDIFGKKLCKQYKVSPDAMMQLGFQVAYYLKNGEVVATYESCSTSAFKHGRTETVRPATLETTKFVKAAASSQLDYAQLKNLITECSKVHGNLTKDAAMGQGFDRHLFGLRKLAEASGGEMPALFTDPSYAKINHIILSTSTLPSTEIAFGGFAPVVRNGFGVGYQIQDDFLGIVLSSYPPNRDGAQFIECAEKAYKIIHDVLTK
ncbi:unnamed protein product, partial [Meganyctiphanes norvegica]